MHHTSTSNPNRPHIATRIDSIIALLNTVKKVAIHKDIELLLADFADADNKTIAKTQRIGENRMLYWVVWYSKKI